jgi:small subunit ribosomal protein S18
MADEQAPRPPAPPAAPSAPSGYQGQGSGGHSGPPRFGGPGGPRPGGPGARPGGPAKRGKRSFVRKKKVCRFCVDKSDYIDYKRAEILAPFLQERGKILPRRMTGTCSRHQRWLTVAIKRAQNIALLPFAAEL